MHLVISFMDIVILAFRRPVDGIQTNGVLQVIAVTSTVKISLIYIGHAEAIHTRWCIPLRSYSAQPGMTSSVS